MIKLQPYQRALSIFFVILFVSMQGSAANEESPLLNTFKQRYDQVRQQVNQGRLSDVAGNKAQDLWLSLRKDLIYLDARIDAYKLEAQETSGSRQQEAMQNLVEVSGERERLLLNAIQALDVLARGKTTDIPISTVKPQTMLSAESSGEGDGDSKKQGKGSISISIEPEDLSAPSWE